MSNIDAQLASLALCAALAFHKSFLTELCKPRTIGMVCSVVVAEPDLG